MRYDQTITAIPPPVENASKSIDTASRTPITSNFQQLDSFAEIRPILQSLDQNFTKMFPVVVGLMLIVCAFAGFMVATDECVRSKVE